MTIDAHRQPHAEECSVTLDGIVQPAKSQRQHFGGKAGLEAAGHALNRTSLHRGSALDQQTWAWTLELIELKHAERWQGAHVVGPKQVHQRVRELGQLIVELLPQSTSEEGEALQQSLDVGVSSTLTQKRRQGRVALSEPLAKPAQRGELALVVVIE